MPLKERARKGGDVAEDNKVEEKIAELKEEKAEKAENPMSKRSSKDVNKYAISNLKVDVKIDHNNQNRKIDE